MNYPPWEYCYVKHHFTLAITIKLTHLIYQRIRHSASISILPLEEELAMVDPMVLRHIQVPGGNQS